MYNVISAQLLQYMGTVLQLQPLTELLGNKNLSVKLKFEAELLYYLIAISSEEWFIFILVLSSQFHKIIRKPETLGENFNLMLTV